MIGWEIGLDRMSNEPEHISVTNAGDFTLVDPMAASSSSLLGGDFTCRIADRPTR